MSLRCKACGRIFKSTCGCPPDNRSRRRWQADYWTGPIGTEKKRHHVTSAPKTPSEAQAWYRALRADAARGRAETTQPRRHRFAEAVARFLPEYAHEVKPTQYANVAGNLRLYLVPVFGRRELSTIDVPGIEAFKRSLQAGIPRPALEARLESLRAWLVKMRFTGDMAARLAAERERILSRPLSARSIRGILVTLGQVLGEATRWGWIPSNPARAVRWKIKGGSKKRFSLTDTELLKLEELTRTMPATRRLPVLLAAFCGLRRGEAFGLQRRDFDRGEGFLTIARTATHGAISTPKTEESAREVAVPEWLGVELSAHIDGQRVVALDGSDWLFPGRGGRPQFHNFERWWAALRNRLADAASDPIRADKPRRELTLHCLRHTYLTMFGEAGVSITVAQAQAGHKSSTMTSHYTHPSRRAKRAGVVLLPTPNRLATDP